MGLKQLAKDVQSDKELMDKSHLYAEIAGLTQTDNDENPWIGKKEAWDKFEKLCNGELAICKKCSEVVKSEGERETMCGACSF